MNNDMNQNHITDKTSGILPWTRSCFVCGQDNPHGLQLKSRVENGQVVLTYTPRERDLGWRRIVHGGISITLLDEVMTWAAILAARRACVAAEVNTRLKEPIRVGQTLRVTGWVTRATSRLILTEGQIQCEQNKILISATGKYVPMPGDQVSLCAEDFVISSDAIHPDNLLEGKGVTTQAGRVQES